MRCHRHATVASSTLDASALARYIESFADISAGWEFPAEKSAQYEEMCGQPSCCIVTASAALPRAAIHLTTPRDGARSLTVSNVVPLVAYQLSIDEYNAVLMTFAHALRAHGRHAAVPIKVLLSKADIRLADVITGKAWKFLQRYLGMHPLSSHPLDIERLDQFICALSRYTKKRIDLNTFQTLLMEELGWSNKDASWCRSRVETGLDLLAINRTFSG